MPISPEQANTDEKKGLDTLLQCVYRDTCKLIDTALSRGERGKLHFVLCSIYGGSKAPVPERARDLYHRQGYYEISRMLQESYRNAGWDSLVITGDSGHDGEYIDVFTHGRHPR